METAKEKQVPKLPDGCGYMGKEFGASYIDSQCFGGRLYDLDYGDGDMLYEPGEFIPCSQCNHHEWLEALLDTVEDLGAGACDDGKPRLFPTDKSKMKYPDDFETVKAAWESASKVISIGSPTQL